MRDANGLFWRDILNPVLQHKNLRIEALNL